MLTGILTGSYLAGICAAELEAVVPQLGFAVPEALPRECARGSGSPRVAAAGSDEDAYFAVSAEVGRDTGLEAACGGDADAPLIVLTGIHTGTQSAGISAAELAAADELLRGCPRRPGAMPGGASPLVAVEVGGFCSLLGFHLRLGFFSLLCVLLSRAAWVLSPAEQGGDLVGRVLSPTLAQEDWRVSFPGGARVLSPAREHPELLELRGLRELREGMGFGDHAVLEGEVPAVPSADQGVALVRRQAGAGGLDEQVSAEALVGELRGRKAKDIVQSAISVSDALQVPGVDQADFSHGPGVGVVPAKKTAKKTAKKAKSKKAAAKASKTGGQLGWSDDDHKYNQLFLARGADFLSSDRDGDGSVSFSELRLASGRISASILRFDEVEEVFRLVDLDKDGVLDVTEYLNAISWVDT